MALTNIDIVSSAMLMLGEVPITSFTDDTTAALVANGLYENIVLSALTTAAWHFATKRVQLSRLVSAPINEYEYGYQIPTDFLQLLDIDNSPNNFQINGDKLYSNEKTIIVEYIYRPDEQFFPSWFIKYLEYELAKDMAIPISASTSKMEAFMTLANEQLERCRFIDATQAPSKGFAVSGFLR